AAVGAAAVIAAVAISGAIGRGAVDAGPVAIVAALIAVFGPIGADGIVLSVDRHGCRSVGGQRRRAEAEKGTAGKSGGAGEAHLAPGRLAPPHVDGGTGWQGRDHLVVDARAGAQVDVALNNRGSGCGEAS